MLDTQVQLLRAVRARRPNYHRLFAVRSLRRHLELVWAGRDEAERPDAEVGARDAVGRDQLQIENVVDARYFPGCLSTFDRASELAIRE